DQLDLRPAEPSRADEFTAVPGLGLPGRHMPLTRGPGDGCRARPDLLVGEQAERGDVIGTMAGSAMLENDRCDVAGEGDARLRRGIWCLRCRRAGDDQTGRHVSHAL